MRRAAPAAGCSKVYADDGVHVVEASKEGERLRKDVQELQRELEKEHGSVARPTWRRRHRWWRT